MDRRRFLLTSLAGVLAAPFAAEAQQAGKVYRIGFLWDTPAVWPHALEAFRQGLRDLGWVEGQNIVIEYRWTQGRFDRLPSLVEELVRLKVDLIVAPTSIYTGAAKRVTATIPSSSRATRTRSTAATSQALRVRAATPRGSPSS
jgi:putative ABC transport system substrate-binding protein